MRKRPLSGNGRKASTGLDFAEQVSDDVAMMFDGEIACMEPPADFFADNVFYRA